MIFKIFAHLFCLFLNAFFVQDKSPFSGIWIVHFFAILWLPVDSLNGMFRETDVLSLSVIQFASLSDRSVRRLCPVSGFSASWPEAVKTPFCVFFRLETFHTSHLTAGCALKCGRNRVIVSC